jgi:hypothetical protein
MSNWDMDKWFKERKQKRIQKAKNLKELGIYLKDLGYKYIRVWYEGAGDSGECFHAEGWKGKINLKPFGLNYEDDYQTKAWNHSKEENFDENKNFTRNQVQLQKEYNKFKTEHPDMKIDPELHWELVNLIDYDWYNNEGGQGQVIWDLEKENIQIDGQQNVYSCRDTNEKYYLNGDDPEYGYGDDIYER